MRKKYKDISEYKIYAYCLMGNHIHLLLQEGKEEIGLLIRTIGVSYVYWYNWKYKRSGHLFQDRYKSEAVNNDSYLLTVIRYIHQNPLKADITSNIENYKWSSYKEYVEANDIVDIDFVLDILNNDREKAIKGFEIFHSEENNDKCLEIEERRRMTDDEAIEITKKICNIKNCLEIQNFELNERDKSLKKLKDVSISTR